MVTARALLRSDGTPATPSAVVKDRNAETQRADRSAVRLVVLERHLQQLLFVAMSGRQLWDGAAGGHLAPVERLIDGGADVHYRAAVSRLLCVAVPQQLRCDCVVMNRY